MYQQVFDARLQHFLRKTISELPLNQRLQLKNIEMCGKHVMPATGGEAGVFVLRNSKGNVATFGQMTCKNTWGCPHCTAYMMKKYATKISAAIDAMRERNFAAVMITFSVPHIKRQSCREVTDILYATWADFMRNAWKTNKNYTNVGKAFNELNIKHYVRVAEYTFGQNGWHPHFHCLFWLPKENLQKLAAFEQDFSDRWEMCRKRQWKILSEIDADIFDNVERQGIKISKDENGLIREQLTSDYIAGWGADKELTGNVQKKASHDCHFTPHQMLEFAADGNENMKNLYIEFLLQVTRKPVHHRVNFDKKGLTKIVAQHMNTKGFKEVYLKKKESDWRVVCWFTRNQWLDICDFDKQSPLISNILYLVSIERNDLLEDFLRSFGVELVKYAHVHAPVVEGIFNVAA